MHMSCQLILRIFLLKKKILERKKIPKERERVRVREKRRHFTIDFSLTNTAIEGEIRTGI
jgi:hypothetical protein